MKAPRITRRSSASGGRPSRPTSEASGLRQTWPDELHRGGHGAGARLDTRDRRDRRPREPARVAFRRADRPQRRALGRDGGSRRRTWGRRHDAGGQPHRMGAGDARLLPDGRCRDAVQPAAAPQGPGGPGPCREPQALHRRGGAARRAARRRPSDDDGRDRGCARRGPPPGDARRRRRARCGGPRRDHLHLGYQRRTEGRALPAAVSDRPASAGRALGRRPQGGARLVHRRPGLVEVDPERLHRSVAPRSRRAAPRRPLRPRRAARRSSSARASTSSARRRPSTACSRSAQS